VFRIFAAARHPHAPCSKRVTRGPGEHRERRANTSTCTLSVLAMHSAISINRRVGAIAAGRIAAAQYVPRDRPPKHALRHAHRCGHRPVRGVAGGVAGELPRRDAQVAPTLVRLPTRHASPLLTPRCQNQRPSSAPHQAAALTLQPPHTAAPQCECSHRSPPHCGPSPIPISTLRPRRRWQGRPRPPPTPHPLPRWRPSDPRLRPCRQR